MFFARLGAGVGTGFAGLCAAFTLLWARVAAKIANRAKPQTLNRCTGIVLLATGAVMLSVDLFFK